MNSSAMKKILLFIGIAVFVLGAFYFLYGDVFSEPGDGQEMIAYPPPQDFPLYPVEQMLKDWRDKTLKGGNFNTAGYIARYFVCPPCPPGAACIQCPGEGLNVSAEAVPETDLATPKILITAEDFRQIELGKWYEFSVAVDADTQEVKLLGYRVLDVEN